MLVIEPFKVGLKNGISNPKQEANKTYYSRTMQFHLSQQKFLI